MGPSFGGPAGGEADVLSLPAARIPSVSARAGRAPSTVPTRSSTRPVWPSAACASCVPAPSPAAGDAFPSLAAPRSSSDRPSLTRAPCSEIDPDRRRHRARR